MRLTGLLLVLQTVKGSRDDMSAGVDAPLLLPTVFVGAACFESDFAPPALLAPLAFAADFPLACVDAIAHF